MAGKGGLRTLKGFCTTACCIPAGFPAGFHSIMKEKKNGLWRRGCCGETTAKCSHASAPRPQPNLFFSFFFNHSSKKSLKQRLGIKLLTVLYTLNPACVNRLHPSAADAITSGLIWCFFLHIDFFFSTKIINVTCLRICRQCA